MEALLLEADRDFKEGKNISPSFDTLTDALAYLKNER